jgi:hypothetical protein
LHVIAEAFRKERPQRPVRHAAREDGVRGRTAFAPREGAGDLSHGVKPFFEVNRQRKEVDIFAWLRAGAGGNQDNGFAQRDRDRAVGLSGEAAGFDD